MAYKTLMVHLELGHPNAGLLQIAGDLAERFDAGVIGIAMCHPMQVIYSEGYVPANQIDLDREQRQTEIAAAATELRAALASRVNDLEFRSAMTLDPLADYLAREARSADLVITGVDRNASLFDNSHHVNIGDIVMHVGRPVLVVPTAAAGLSFERVLVGWKDSRETRRAVTDALPFLKRAAHVTVVEIAGNDELESARARVDDVVLWFGRHGIAAEPVASPAINDDAHRLHALAQEYEAGLIVAGAYGHSRVREWVLGGVTRDLLLRAGQCALVSH